MKYIRTKDAIYEVDSWHDYDFSGREYTTKDKQSIDSIEVRKASDTIENICDQFIVIKTKLEEDGCRYIDTGSNIEVVPAFAITRERLLFKKYGKAIQAYRKPDGVALFGAIWTDKGLIYVAKMNEEGGLELL